MFPKSLFRSCALGLIFTRGHLAAAPPSPEAPLLVLQTPPATAVNSVAVSPDGSLVATAAGEGGVRLYDAKTGALLRAIGEAGDRSVTFSPDGRTLAAGGFHMDKLVGIYDVQTGKRVRTLAGHTEWEADACTFSPDGKLLASTGTDKQILVWDLATGDAPAPARGPALPGHHARLLARWRHPGLRRRQDGPALGHGDGSASPDPRGPSRLGLHRRLLAGRDDHRQRELRLVASTAVTIGLGRKGGARRSASGGSGMPPRATSSAP